MADEHAERERQRNRLAMDWHDLGSARIQLGKAERAFASVLGELGRGGQTPVRVGLAGMFAGWRDRKLRLDSHFDRLERETMRNEGSEP